MSQARTTVVIADDHATTRQGVRLIAESLQDVEVIGEAGTGLEAVTLCERLHPNLILMDLGMPELGGVEAIKRVKEIDPETAVLVFSVHDDEAAISEAMRAGASGYLPKSASLDELRNALDALRHHGVYMPPAIAGKLFKSLQSALRETRETAAAVDMITAREREILTLLGEGYSARRIASTLGIRERTVNTHVGNIYRKLGVNNRVDAIREAMRLRLIEIPH